MMICRGESWSKMTWPMPTTTGNNVSEQNEASLLLVGLHVVFLYISATVLRIMNYHVTVFPIDR